MRIPDGMSGMRFSFVSLQIYSSINLGFFVVP